jgi:hypothetical protein
MNTTSAYATLKDWLVANAALTAVMPLSNITDA